MLSVAESKPRSILPNTEGANAEIESSIRRKLSIRAELAVAFSAREPHATNAIHNAEASTTYNDKSDILALILYLILEFM